LLDPATFTYRWTHPDARMDRLHLEVCGLVEAAARGGEDAAVTFECIRAAAFAVADAAPPRARVAGRPGPRPTRSPRLTESWFCCAEPTESQLDAVDDDAGRWR
jgi:hypothetical protein